MNEKLNSLREKAEQILNDSAQMVNDIPLGDFNRIIHNLKVYQIELELQNEELRSAQKQLEESRNRYAELYNEAPAGYVTLNSTGTILQVNLTFLHMVNLDLPEVLNFNFSAFLSGSDRHLFLSRYNAFFKNPADKTIELELLRRGGKPIYIRITGNLKNDVLKSNGNRSGEAKLFLIIHDITHSKQIEADLIALNETLEERVALRTKELESSNRELQFHLHEIEQFGYISSHDLQEPLRTLSTFSQLVVDEYSDKIDDTGKKYLEFILNSAGRMRELVKGLLEYSLLGKEGVKASTDCNAVISDVLNDLAESIKESGTSVIMGNLPVVQAYTTELRVLFQNLITNAIKFRSTDHPLKIGISAVPDEHGYLFSIEDNGIGIAANDREKIFVIFKRLHNRNLYPGTGIGLAHCKKIAELHGGKIWVEPVEGRGSKFYFTIPH